MDLPGIPRLWPFCRTRRAAVGIKSLCGRAPRLWFRFIHTPFISITTFARAYCYPLPLYLVHVLPLIPLIFIFCLDYSVMTRDAYPWIRQGYRVYFAAINDMEMCGNDRNCTVNRREVSTRSLPVSFPKLRPIRRSLIGCVWMNQCDLIIVPKRARDIATVCLTGRKSSR